ncbi:MAG: hypothetical protein ACE5ID_05390 [Acidobacteriota bacterium]
MFHKSHARHHLGGESGWTPMILSLAAGLAVGLSGCGSEPATTTQVALADSAKADTPQAAGVTLDPSILDDSSRSDDDRKRDDGFKPLEVYGFFGVEPGMTVADLWPGHGYNTQILSGAVGSNGKVLAVLGPLYNRGRYADRVKGFVKERMEQGHLDNVEIVETLEEIPANSVDVMITVRNYHDLGEAKDRVAVLPGLLRALKPGGILGVVDAFTPKEGRDEEHHRINEELVVSEITGAGFELVGRSPVLENRKDTYDFDGREDDAPIHRYFIHRFVHKYRKPAGQTAQNR